jgi:hypothetical protein
MIKCVLLVTDPELTSTVLSETGEPPRASGGGVVAMSDKYTVSRPNFTVLSEEVSKSVGTATGYNDSYL